VDQAAEEIAARDGKVGTGSHRSARLHRVRRTQGERAVRPMSVVVVAVGAQQVVEVTATQDQAAIEAVAAERPYPALGGAFAFGACSGV
jgi:hypothetical protein